MASPKILTAKHAGFTLVEIVVSLAILTILFSLGLLMSMDALRGSTFRSERESIVSILLKARSRSMANIDGSAWGVCYRAPKYVLFKGGSCATPATTDEEFDANQGVALASNFAATFPTFTFSQLSGQSNGGTITITQNGRTSVVSINHEGTINW
jgi:prepilin-type N-terminal cleavage/methylation domain-containing protein